MICDSYTTKPFTLPPKGHIFVQNVTRWLPGGVLTWLSERSRGEVPIKLQRNRAEAHRVAQELIEVKKEELRAGASRADTLSLLGSSSWGKITRVALTVMFSQRKLESATRMAVERRRDRCSSPDYHVRRSRNHDKDGWFLDQARV